MNGTNEMDDAELAELIQRDARLIGAEKERAGAAYERARMAHGTGASAWVRDLWEGARNALLAVQPVKVIGGYAPGTDLMKVAVAEFRIAREAAETFQALSELGQDDVMKLREPYSAGTLARTPAARAVLLSRPALARLVSKMDAAAAQADERQQREVERLRIEAPANLIRSLRSRGIFIELVRGDRIEASGAIGKALPSELDGLRDWRGEIMELLKAEKAAVVKSPVLVI